MDPDGKTKILTILNIKLPHQNGIDNVRVKVNNGAVGNILPLDSLRTMFPHVLDEQCYPKDGFLRRYRTKLECYDDGKLINHGSIKLRLQHYSDKSFQDHSYYVIETKTCKEIIVRHAASSRLGLIKVLCKNVSKSVSAIENKTNTSSRDSCQDHCLKIDSKTQWREPGSCIWSPFKTINPVLSRPWLCACALRLLSRPQPWLCAPALRLLTRPQPTHKAKDSNTWYKWTHFKTLGVDGIRVIRETYTETPFKTPAKTNKVGENSIKHKLTPFKTPGVDGIRIIREKDNANRVKDTVKITGRETSFKTPGKSLGGKRFPSRTRSIRSVWHLLSRSLTKVALIEFLFKTIEDTSNKSDFFQDLWWLGQG